MSNSNTLSLNLKISGSGTISVVPDVLDYTTESFAIGTNAGQFPGDINPSLNLSTGTGNMQANQWYSGQRTVAAGAYDNINLLTQTNGRNQACTFSRIVGIFLCLVNHDGIKNLKIGPQAQVNAWQGPFQSTGADQALTVYWKFYLDCDYINGIGTVAAGTNILPVYNPTASSITYSIFIVGVQ